MCPELHVGACGHKKVPLSRVFVASSSFTNGISEGPRGGWGTQTRLLWIGHVVLRGSTSLAGLPTSGPRGGPFINCTASTGQRVDWLGGCGGTTSCAYCCSDLLPGVPALVLHPGPNAPFFISQVLLSKAWSHSFVLRLGVAYVLYCFWVLHVLRHLRIKVSHVLCHLRIQVSHVLCHLRIKVSHVLRHLRIKALHILCHLRGKRGTKTCLVSHVLLPGACQRGEQVKAK